MPIRGVTDQQGGLPVIGRLRKGDPKPAKGPGRDTDHFRFTSGLSEVEKQFQSVYGDKPAELQVYLPYRDLERNFPHNVEKWQAAGLMWRGDGEYLSLWYDGKARAYVNDPEYRQKQPCPDDVNAKWTGRLFVILPQLWEAGYMGLVMLTTTSKHDVLNLVRELIVIRDNAPNADFRGIAFRLFRMEDTIARPTSDGGRTLGTHFGVHLAALPLWQQPLLDKPKASAYAGLIAASAKVVDPKDAKPVASQEPQDEPLPQPDEEIEDGDFTPIEPEGAEEDEPSADQGQAEADGEEEPAWPEVKKELAAFVTKVKALVKRTWPEKVPPDVTLERVIKEAVLGDQYSGLVEAARDGCTAELAMELIGGWCQEQVQEKSA